MTMRAVRGLRWSVGTGTFVTATGHFYRYSRRTPSPNANQVTFLHEDSARAAALVQAAEREGITKCVIPRSVSDEGPSVRSSSQSGHTEFTEGPSSFHSSR